MRAIDTNVVVRFLVGDDPEQAARARAAIEAGDIFISSTVLLETEWVLRGGYGMEAGRITGALRALAGLDGVSVQTPAQLALALDWADTGLDFADAMHLAAAEGCEAFLSFDRKLAQVPAGRSSISVLSP